MRLDYFRPLRPGHDPKESTLKETFESGHIKQTVLDYDIFEDNGNVYIFRVSDGKTYGAKYTSAGEALFSGKYAEDLHKTFKSQYPRKNAGPEAKKSV